MTEKNKIRVTIVEDDPRFSKSLAGAVMASGMQIAGVARSTAEARLLLNASQPDVLLVDLGLPDGSGIGLIRETARLYPECSIMVVTIFGDDRNIIEAIRAGATGYLLKDASTAQIAEQIRVLHGGGSPISPKIARRMLKLFAPPSAARDTSNAGLSERELEMLQLAAKGFSYDEIAGIMSVSRQTVLTYAKRSYRKLQVNSKAEAIYEARQHGLVRD